MKSQRIRLKDIATLEQFILAVHRAALGKKSRPDVQRYIMNSFANTLKIRDAVRNGNYWPSPYHEFHVKDPKERLVQALPFADRIVHQWLVEEVIKPYFIPRFITDNYACIPGRGTHAAVYRLKDMLHEVQHDYLERGGPRPYALKMDISKFFPSVDRDVLFKIITRRIADPALVELFRRIIYDPGVKGGIPIGNYTSQYFANIYLNELDHYAKEKLHLHYYVRYMDDFIIVVKDKQTAREVFDQINDYVTTVLHLKLNPKSRILPAMNGIDFAGYIIYPNQMRLRKRSKKSLRRIVHDYTSGKDSAEKHKHRRQAWLGHARHADKYDHYAKKVLGGVSP